MSATERFAEFAGQEIRVTNEDGHPLFMYVLAEGDLDEDALEELIGDLHPNGSLDEGWTVVAIEGEIEDGEADAGGFIAIHEENDKAYLCDSGTIVPFKGPASEITIRPGHGDGHS